jgi:hypothetical protein
MKKRDRREAVEVLEQRSADSVKGDPRAGQGQMFEAERRLERSPP